MILNQKGFSFIELMVVVVILGILAGMIVPRYMGRTDEAKAVKAKVDISAIETSLKLYRLDNGAYPTTEQGLMALIEKPSTEPVPPKWNENGYLDKKKMPKDPWGREYLYLSPGVHQEFDILSYGADGAPGGKEKMRILKAGSLNRSGPISGSISGFSLVELVVVLFILSVLAFFSIPVIKGLGPGQDPAGGSRQLAQFIKGVRQKAIRENQDYTLHLDTISGQAWAQVSEDSAQNSEDADKSDDPDKSNDADETQTPGSTLSGISITRVDVFNRPDTDAGTTLIRVGGNGITDMALIHMITREEGDITLKLHPFIQDVDIIQGDLRFNDCP